MPKKVAVIGAGICGLIALKCCKDEGLDVVCFEMTPDIGGLWRYTDKEENKACVMKSTTINTSKELMAFSDFPPPEDFPNYMHNTKVMQYFRLYAEKNDLGSYIKYQQKVELLKKADDFEQNGTWNVRVRDLATDKVTNYVFDAVLLCTGHHADKNMPHFPGLEDFQGTVIHSKEYKKPAGYEDKKVLVVGLGNSGSDVAVELSKTADQVYLAVRTGTYCLNRVGKEGWPIDSLYVNRANAAAANLLPKAILMPYIRKLVDERMDHELYGLLPNHEPMQNHPLINDFLPNCLLSGIITLKPNVRRFFADGVEFEDGTIAKVDTIVFATGYIFGFPFLDPNIIEVSNNKVKMYKYIFPPDLTHPTLAVIGCFQPNWSTNPIAEMQSRLATRVIKGLIKLPSKEAMWQDIRGKASFIERQFYSSQRHTMEVDTLPFVDEMAEIVGCKPSLGKLWITNPVLAYKCFFGMWTPCQYRLMGPGAWSGAEHAIRTLEDRIRKPLQTRKPARHRGRGWGGLITLSFYLLVLYLLYDRLSSWFTMFTA